MQYNIKQYNVLKCLYGKIDLWQLSLKKKLDLTVPVLVFCAMFPHK